MPIVNKLKTILDQPVWEWTRFAPVATTSQAALTTAEDGSNRYLYYLVGTSGFFRYDAVSDSWLQLASPVTSPATLVAMRYTKYNGQRGRVLGSVSSTKITIPYISGGKQLIGTTLRITTGAGIGQERTITDIDPEFVNDSGLATTASTTSIQDTTKKWKPNQWVGYTCRVTYNSAQTLQRTIIYNTVDTVFFADNNYQPYESFDNQIFSLSPSATGGAQSHFTILSQNVTVNSAYSVTPDSTSRFQLNTGAIWLISQSGSGGFFTFQMYDVANDIWMTKTANGGIFGAGVATDIGLERFGEQTGALVSGTASSGTNRTLVDSTKTLTQDRYRNYQLRITGGTGIGQRRRIVANGSTYLEVERKWDINPDNTSTYAVYPDTDSILFGGNNQSVLLKYSIDADYWTINSMVDYGMANQMSIVRSGTLPVGVTSAVRNTGGITGVAVNFSGTGYKIGDILTIAGGTLGKVYVESISSAGGVVTVSVFRPGSGYSTATAATVTGGTGSGCTINITAVGVVGYITTAINHMFKIGDSITFSGASESAWNTTYTVIGCDAATTLDVAITATANAAAAVSHSTTVVVDVNKNWDVNEHVGRLIYVYAGGTAGATQIRRIVSNTANSITVTGTITAASNGLSRYALTDPAALGRDNQFQRVDQYGFGYATSGSTTTIVDSTKNWVPGAWIGYRVRITAGTGYGNEIAITDSTSTTLTFTTQTFTPDTTTRYEIMDTFGIATGGSTTTLVDSTKNWKVNQWAGKRVRFISGTGASVETSITSNTSNTLTFALTTSPDTTTNYVIYSIPVRGSGINLIWTYGNGNDRSVWYPRGSGVNTFDRYDIPTEMYEYGMFLSPNTDTFTNGTMYSYSGGDRIYIQKDVTGRIYYFDVVRREVVNSGQIPYGMGSATIGNKMEIVTTTDGLQFLYVMRHSGQEMWRMLIFW